MQPHRQRCDLAHGVLGPCTSSRVATPRQGRDHLLDQPDLTIGGCSKRPQVARLETEVGQLAGGLGDHEGVGVEVAGAGAGRDETELLESDEHVLVDVGDLEKFLALELFYLLYL